jgi:hypothetical protein
MREGQLEEKLKRAEEVYEGLLQAQRSLGTMLAEAITKERDFDEFGRHLRELPHLIWQADLRRTELRHALLERQAKRAEDEYRRAAEEAEEAARSLEQTRKAYLEAEEAVRHPSLEARRLAELRDKEVLHLQELRRAQQEEREEAQHSRGVENRREQEHQRGEQGGKREETRGGDQAAQEQRRQGEERAHDPGRAYGDVQPTLGADSIAGENANQSMGGLTTSDAISIIVVAGSIVALVVGVLAPYLAP